MARHQTIRPVIEFTGWPSVQPIPRGVAFISGGPIFGSRSIVESCGVPPSASAHNLYPPRWWGQPENPKVYIYPFSELVRVTPLAFVAVIPWILVAITFVRCRTPYW